MNLEQQVVSLDLAKRLAELGVRQESYFYWISRMEGDEEVAFVADEKHWKEFYEGQYDWVNLSAFTVAELGEMLPYELPDGFLNCIRRDSWIVEYGFPGMIKHHKLANTEADARAKMLIYLLENKLLQL